MENSAANGLSLRWEGAQFVRHSLAYVNRELCRGVLVCGQVELSLVPTEPDQFNPADYPALAPLAPRVFAPLSCSADVHVRHHFPPRFDPPDEGHFVLIQPWEYGYLPRRWIDPIKDHVCEAWCYSEYVRQVYLASGIPEERLQVIPLGVNTVIFNPEAPPYIFTTEPGASRVAGDMDERFVFLYAGGTLHRKGIDILLEAYLKAFAAYDDVCLVIKDTGTRSVYYKQNEQERILSLVDDQSRPPIVYLDDDLSPHQLAGIYTAADCIVLPYRGEGFCLPALEAMACGRPAIVPLGGPTDDFVDETVGWRLPAEKKQFGKGKIGEWDCVEQTWMFEVPVEALIKQMRQLYKQRDEVKKRGAAAAERVQAGWTWTHSCAKALERLQYLKTQSQESCPTCQNRDKSKAVRRTDPDPVAASKRVSKGAVRRATNQPPALALRKDPTISLCMIVKNEERVLADCLKSVKPFVDEIVLVDTGSTDRTVEIAKSFGVKLYHFPWCDSFSAARNESLSHATGKWLFWMDADDTLPEECGKMLHGLLFLAENRVTGYMMQVHIPPAPGDFGFTVVDHVKLFRNWPELRFEGRIHEQILDSIYRAGGTIDRSGLHVVHSGYDHSPDGQKRKRERDFHLIELDIQERPDHPFPRFNKGMTHFHLREFDQAIEALEKSLSLSQPWESTVRKLYAMLAGCYIEQRNYDEGRRWAEEGLQLFPGDPELLFRTANLYRDLGDLAHAEQVYQTLFTASESGHIDSIDVTMTGFKAHFNLGGIYQEMGRLKEAEREWQAAISDYPQFVPSWRALAELYTTERRFDDARAIALRLTEFAPSDAERIFRRIAEVRGLSYGDQAVVRALPAVGPDITATASNGSEPKSTHEPDWDQAPLFGRRLTLMRALKELNRIHPGPATIVETGTLRDEKPQARDGDGWSTLAWGWYCGQVGGRAFTVDVDPGALEICQRITASFATHIEYVQMDSVNFLKQWSERKWGEIHLLYLDSLDYFDKERSETHSLAEIEAALPALAPSSLVLLDDTSVAGKDSDGSPILTGKGARTVPYLLSKGFQLECGEGGQILLRRITEPSKAVVTVKGASSTKKQRTKNVAK